MQVKPTILALVCLCAMTSSQALASSAFHRPSFDDAEVTAEPNAELHPELAPDRQHGNSSNNSSASAGSPHPAKSNESSGASIVEPLPGQSTALPPAPASNASADKSNSSAANSSSVNVKHDCMLNCKDYDAKLCRNYFLNGGCQRSPVIANTKCRRTCGTCCQTACRDSSLQGACHSVHQCKHPHVRDHCPKMCGKCEPAVIAQPPGQSKNHHIHRPAALNPKPQQAAGSSVASPAGCADSNERICKAVKNTQECKRKPRYQSLCRKTCGLCSNKSSNATDDQKTKSTSTSSSTTSTAPPVSAVPKSVA